MDFDCLMRVDHIIQAYEYYYNQDHCESRSKAIEEIAVKFVSDRNEAMKKAVESLELLK